MNTDLSPRITLEWSPAAVRLSGGLVEPRSIIRSWNFTMAAAWLCLGSILSIPAVGQAETEPAWPPAPEFSSDKAQDWLNSEPLSVSDLRGRVILLDVWTYSCHNCYRSIPWLLRLEQVFDSSEFGIVGIHTPEFNHERRRRNVERKLKEFDITHPVMLDNDFQYWKSLSNRYWPSFYLIDKSGRLRAYFIGETHTNSSQARTIEKQIAKLLAEPIPAAH